MHCRLALMLLTASALVASEVRAQHPGDILVELDGNQVVTGLIDENQTVTTDVRVFKSTFGDSGFDGFTTNPGFDALPGTFNPAYRVGFNILDALRVWNGAGLEPTGGETLNISFSTLESETAECFVPGFDLAVQANGGWHRHLSFWLMPDGRGEPGIYVLKMHLYYTAPGSEQSEPFWMVFNHNGTAQDHDAAYAWVLENLASCPADVNHDGVVNVADLLAVIGAWGKAPCEPADINLDGSVNVADLLAVIAAWGACA